MDGGNGHSRERDLAEQLLVYGLRREEVDAVVSRLSLDKQVDLTENLLELLRRASALLEVYRRVADSLSLDVLLPRMVELISDFLQTERCTIFLYDCRTDELYSRIAQGDGVTEIRFQARKGIAGTTFQTGEAIHISDAYSDPRFNQDVDRETGFHTRNMLCAPIRDIDSRMIGVIQVLNKIDGDFTPGEEIPLLETLAQQASSGFTNAQLHEEIAKARKEEAQLLEVTTALSRELNLRPLLLKIMNAVTTILDADRSTLFLYDARSSELWSHVALGMDAKTIRIPADAGIAGSVFSTGKPINIPDAYRDPRFNRAVDRKTGYKTDSILCMPIINKSGTAIGVIQVLNKAGGPFTGDDERRLDAFCSQASVAIENAKLFEDIIEMKNYNESILQSMSNGVVTIDAERTIRKVNQAALRILAQEASPEAIFGIRARDFFTGGNSWVIDSINKICKTGAQDITMDANLYRGELAGSTPGARQKEDAASVNVTVVPLANAKNQQIGCLLLIEDISIEKRLKGTMARYMTKEVADKLLEEGEDALGGKVQKATVLFTDIRGFTSISEQIGAQETVTMLNEYFSIMVDVLLDHGGILDKYIGDAMMAVFGAPFVGEMDADQAVRAGIQMLKALAEFNAYRAAHGKDPIRMGVGINTDEVLSGNIGSLKRMDYTVIGDGVNLASRLEGANKLYRTQMLISESTMAELKHEYQLREIDRIRVKGKHRPVAVFEVLDYCDEQTCPNVPELIRVFSSALKAYKATQWDRAIELFQQALALNDRDGVSRLYLERCRAMKEHPPPAGWDGVFTMQSK